MKWNKKLQICLLFSMIISLMLPSVVFAQEAYTYTVTLYAGNQGALTGAGIEIVTTGDDVKVEQSADKIVISGLQYKDDINFVAQYAANVTNEKYYVSGIRKSGRDNSELELSSYEVTGDKDYVVAYAIRGNVVTYTVNYQDESGKALLESESFYGNIGERPVIAYRYIDGYTPQAYNLTKTLSADESENVFTFVYRKLDSGTTETGTTEILPPTTTEGEDDDRASAPIRRVITIIRETIVGDDGSDSDANGSGDNAGGDQAAGENGTAGGNGDGSAEGEDLDSTMIFDDETPLSLLELVDDEVPLAGFESNNDDDDVRPGTDSNLLPIYAGIGIIALIALLFLIIYLVRKKKKESSEDKNEQAEQKE